MKQKIPFPSQWLPPILLLIVGSLLYFFVDGHSFLGLVCWGIAVVLSLYRLLALWAVNHSLTAKAVRTILSTFLILGLLISGVTLILILGGGNTQGEPCEYLVVLGAGIKGYTPSRILQDRIDRAYDYLTANPQVICIASGAKGSDEQISEAQCIYNSLTAMGIDPERIWLEERSTNTAENFQFTLALLEEKTGSIPARISVVSNEFHLFRAALIARDQGVEAQCISAPTSWISLRLNYTLREVFALWKYLIFGGNYHD